MVFIVPPPKSAANGSDILMSIPSHIIIEILSRLPAKSLVQCKSVCKQWLDLTSDPYFAKLHFTRSKPGVAIHQSEPSKNLLRVADFDDFHDPTAEIDLKSLSPSPEDAAIVVDGSVKGLLLLRDANYKHEALYVCNPLTREYIELASPKQVVRYPSVVTHGFGVTKRSEEFKVVRIYQEREMDPGSGSCLGIPNSECQVYTLGTAEWRGVGDAPFAYDGRLIGQFFRGNLHWLVEDLNGQELISCFDLENESFHPFPPPFPGRKLLGSVGVLDDCLCLCDNTSNFEVDIWVMKEYGVGKSWSKRFVIRKMPELIGPSFEIVRVLKVLGDGNILLVWADYCVLNYCSKSEVTQEVDMVQSRGPNSVEAMHYVPSLMSLKSFVMEKLVMF
ncbi:F-box protein At3g07870-like [Salvia miltiorrhiza]|uniref:Kelch repeat F-box 6 protein n=1 Tax=Salvia miltiorrhiza TaxID=226208 RepID=A0A7H1K132_SALMI|nr:F-box protein At3g07870-like [Salvia miltiorrhiza]QNT17570.1 Kelch repeat F-box 6 protein [Salvia miltiorrhiza]